MNAYNASRGFAAPAQPVVANDRRSPFAATMQSEVVEELHNSRGLILAVLMSAACWAGIGLAFLL